MTCDTGNETTPQHDTHNETAEQLCKRRFYLYALFWLVFIVYFLLSVQLIALLIHTFNHLENTPDLSIGDSEHLFFYTNFACFISIQASAIVLIIQMNAIARQRNMEPHYVLFLTQLKIVQVVRRIILGDSYHEEQQSVNELGSTSV